MVMTADLCDARDDVRVCRTQFLSWGRKKAFEKILAAAYPHVRFRVKVALTVFYEECVAHLDCPVV